MDVNACWRSHPHEWQPLFADLRAKYPDLTALHVWPQMGGERVVGLTLGAQARGEAGRCRSRILIAVPHAHEPACTAAAVDFVHQVLTGASLDGSPTAFDRERILRESVITVLPDTNTQGRVRSPERCWDGTKYDNDAFLKVAFGVAAGGERFGRYPEWRYSEHVPERVGIVYEQVDEDLWVEPNTSRRSTHSRMIDSLFERYEYTHMLDMHQHEGDEAALLPGDFELQSEERQAIIRAWGLALIEAWRKAGANPRPEPSIPYRGQPRQQFFIDFWKGRCPGMFRLVSEVRNNRHSKTGTPTPMEHQFRMTSTAIAATIAFAFA